MQFTFHCELTAQPEGGFVATFPDVPEAMTQGETREEAIAEAADALEVALLYRMKHGQDLPEPSGLGRRGRNLADVQPRAQACAKLALYAAFRASGISAAELARRCGVHETEARRMLDPHHATKLPALEAALAALGRRLKIETEAA